MVAPRSSAPPVMLVLLCVGLSACAPDEEASHVPRSYVGRDACIECHETEHDLWTGSHHDLAMDRATAETVLADFGDATLEHFGVTSRMFTRDGRYFVETEGPDGRMHEYEVRYAFGVYPLQQYLVPFPGGRLQTLPLCWDTRPAEAGGQRWFHIYPEERIAAGDELHWTGLNQNWNYMCAECHSTDLRKNFDLQADAFATSWEEIDVSCEACHGPASAHVEWARAEREGRPSEAVDRGMTVILKSGDDGIWRYEPGEPTAKRTHPRASRMEIETCARCHSRRGTLTDDYRHGAPILESHRVSLLDEGLYHADGQIDDEVYVYGSFVQSRMYAAGVACSDCHDPHTTRVYATGNDLCAKCHTPTTFDVESHHFHPGPRGGPGTNCVDCHMPVRTYMVVDDRRDHSFRVPRPDLSLKLGTPNACNLCHAEEGPEWAAKHVAEWYGPDRRQEWHYGQAIHAGRTGAADAVNQLTRLAADPEQPAIARATGLSLLSRYPGVALAEAIRNAAGDPAGLVRLGAAEAALGLPPDERVSLIAPLLDDPLLAVRAAAAASLAPAVSADAPAALLASFERAEREYVATQLAAAERPESHLNLGLHYQRLGRETEAEDAYRTALRLAPAFTPAAVNLADLRRTQGRDGDAEGILREALKRTPQSPTARHALGLTLVRLGRHGEALSELRLATEYAPDSPRYAYVYAVALESLGRPDEALELLRRTHQSHPRDLDVLRALEAIARRDGLINEAETYSARLRALESQ